MKSDVYFAKTPESDLKNRSSALLTILEAASPFLAYKKDELIPVKITIGDSQCIYHLPSELVKIVISEIKKKKTKPFLFDTNVIYKGQRTNAIDHLNLIQNKGFAHSKVGAPFIIADGMFGQDGKDYKLDSEHIKKIRLPSFIGMLDNIVVLSHVTSHILSKYAGSIKNVAMGICSKPTKQVQHSSLKPQVTEANCTACGCCIQLCPVDAITLTHLHPGIGIYFQSRDGDGGTNKARIDQSKCIGCGECLCACKFDAIAVNWHEDVEVFYKRMVDVAAFILSKFKNKFFVNFAFDITDDCDCISTKHAKKICSDIGILASSDILSLDKATLDLMKKEECSSMFDYAYKKGLGNLEYNLINL